jgi:NAD(P)-dependent dehydrogenase (short-subunit alcohol dehydrogenase family)
VVAQLYYDTAEASDAWLASDEARYVTGVTLPVDAGATAPGKIPNV